MPGSKKAGDLSLAYIDLLQARIGSVIICTEGVDSKRYLSTVGRPITEFIAPDANEATIIKLENNGK